MKCIKKISIIMSVFNPQEGNLFGAVQSMVHQSFQNWEMILYDDGSKEEFIPGIRRAAALDDRIFYIRDRQNRGLAHALNECIWRACGEYVARMDDDDLSKPERLEKQCAFLESYPQYQWVGSNAELIDQFGVWGLQKMPEYPQKRDFLFNSPYIHPSVMFRREALIRAGGYNAAREYLHCEDYELFMRLHKSGGRGYNIQEPLLQYWEGYESYKKRTYRRRMREMKVRRQGFKALGILNRATYHYVLKPLMVGAVPPPVHHYINRRLKRER